MAMNAAESGAGGVRRMTLRFPAVLAYAVVALLLAWSPSARAFDIGPILNSCPQHDPAYQQIRNDFEIRRDGVLVGDIPCVEPIAQIPLAQFTQELITVQSLRAVYYMDLGPTHLPWAPEMKLYDWMKSKHAGIDIRQDAAFSSCCETINGKLFFIQRLQDDLTRTFDREWRGLSGNIALFAHELRHLDGFPHVSCCPAGFDACDQKYDETNLSPYGIQWWLNAHWLDGSLYDGFSCLLPSAVQDIVTWHLEQDNGSGYQSRFCTNPPPTLTAPPVPGGECRPPASPLTSAFFTPLTLLNGWTNAPFNTRGAGVALKLGIVNLTGAIATRGTNPVPFVLPSGFRPPTNVYVSVDLCNATKGRLEISPDGTVTVVDESGTFSNAQCFTSLESVSFAVSTLGFTALTLQNGWTNAPFSTRNAAVTSLAGIISLEGAIATGGTNQVPFVLPVGFRPPTSVFVPVDLCDGKKGRLHIQTNGAVTVYSEAAFSDAQCFTSLEGASFASSTSGFTALALQNGWTNAPFGTRNAAVANVSGLVRLAGAIANGTSPVTFTLPSGFRPTTDVYVPVDLCNAKNGRLHIQPTGTVTVQAEGGTLANAQCFTSLEGVSFSL
jgi:hypothetical protein